VTRVATGPSTRFFAVKTTGGWEKTVTSLISTRIALKKKPIYSILVLETLRGYVFLEANNAQVVGETVSGFKHVKSQVPGMIQFPDLEKFLISKPTILELGVNDIVEIVGGPFKGMRAKINRLEVVHSEVTIVLLDAAYQMPVTIKANYLKLVEKARVAAT